MVDSVTDRGGLVIAMGLLTATGLLHLRRVAKKSALLLHQVHGTAG